MDKINELYDRVKKYEDHYYDLAYKCFENNNMQGNIMNSAQATAFQRVRYTIEEMFFSQE